MSDLIAKIIQTRKTAEEIAIKSLENIGNISEAELRDRILAGMRSKKELWEEGYYSPPPTGIGVIFDRKPFARLKYDSLRSPEYWPNIASKFGKETAGMIYFSPMDRQTNMLGDIGFTIYRGSDVEVKKHIKKAYKAILAIAQYANVGMSFSDLCSFATLSLKDKFKISRWITRSSNPVGMNLGHTVPGSYEDLDFGKSFKEVKDTIEKKRIFIKETQNFRIPETCAFTIESRLEDAQKPQLPSIHFHFIVCFDKGKKTILNNFEEIFKVAGMDYMNA